jgi:hypothetical protein
MWTLAFGHHEDRTPTHDYEATREAAMAAFAKSWRRAVPTTFTRASRAAQARAPPKNTSKMGHSRSAGCAGLPRGVQANV